MSLRMVENGFPRYVLTKLEELKLPVIVAAPWTDRGVVRGWSRKTTTGPSGTLASPGGNNNNQYVSARHSPHKVQ